MPIQRNWIVGIGFDDDFSIPNNDQEEPLRESVQLFARALAGLADRIDGVPVLAAVPESDRIDFLRAVALEEATPPIHLIMPHECAERLRSGDPSDLGGLVSLCRSAASINVQPGRGVSENDWNDCDAWLESVTEIRLRFGAPTEPQDVATEKPTVRIDVSAGSIAFEDLSPGKPKTDSEFSNVIETAFKKAELPDSLEETKQAASDTAGLSAPLTRILESCSLFLNLAPSLIFGVGSAMALTLQQMNPWTFAAALAAGLVALGLSRIGPSQAWLSGRVVAEICRTLMASRHFLDPLFPPAAEHLPAYASLIRTLSLSDAAAGNCGTNALLESRDRYLKERLDGQINYFQRQAKIAKKRERKIKWLFYSATVLAFVANLVALLFYLGQTPGITSKLNEQWIEGFAAWVFPAAAAGAIGFLAIHETSRRAHVYERLAEQLAGRRKVLAELRSESSVTEAVRDTEHFLTAELADWLNQRLF